MPCWRMRVWMLVRCCSYGAWCERAVSMRSWKRGSPMSRAKMCPRLLVTLCCAHVVWLGEDGTSICKVA
eukprot:9497510-Pyramimonas_sp.AAC.1